MSVIFNYIGQNNFKENYEKYGEIAFEVFLHVACENSILSFKLLKEDNDLLDDEHKLKLLDGLAYNSRIMHFNESEFKVLPDALQNKVLSNIRKFGNPAILDKYINDLEEHDIILICSDVSWLSKALIVSREKNFKRIVEYLFTNSLEEVLSSNHLQLFLENTKERREYIVNKLIKTVDIRVLLILIRANCVDDIANTYRQKHIDYFVSEMETYNDVVLYRFIRSFRKTKLPDVVEEKLLANNAYMCLDVTRCKTICTKNNISAELKTALHQFIRSQYVLKQLNT